MFIIIIMDISDPIDQHIRIQYAPLVIYMYIQGLLLNEKESLIPNDCHCGETNCTGMIQIYWFRPENNALLMLIDNPFAHNGCFTKYCYGLISTYIIDRY